MNEQASTASKMSEVRRPSRYRTTNPQTMPSGNPFKKMAATFHSAGTTANRANAASAAPMSSSSNQARRPRESSEQTLMPMNFEVA